LTVSDEPKSGDKPNWVVVPGPDPDWLSKEPWKTDQTAEFEEKSFPIADDLPGQVAKNKVQIQKTFGWCIPTSIVGAFALFWIAILVYVFHLLTPWGWLEATAVEHLKGMLFSSAVGALVAEGARRYM
jgi:hypothetical protein